MTFNVPEKYRLKDQTSPMYSDDKDGNNGCFIIPRPGRDCKYFTVIASDGLGWEHVSVSLPSRCPAWEEMCYIKSLFWSEDDCVIQYHPSKDQYVNNHPHCLHMWRPVNQTIPIPHSLLVGYNKTESEGENEHT